MTIEVNEYIPNVNEKPRVDIKDPEKFNHEFRVEKAPGGFVFYHVTVSKGSVPAELNGQYTRMENAVKAVCDYIKGAPVSKSVARDKYAEKRAKEKAEAS